MEINKRNRTELKSFFVKNAIPTEGEFADLIDGTLNQKDDGIAKLPGSPLTIEASGDGASQKKAISFYKQFSDPNPSWVLSLNPRSDPDNPTTAKPGFSISNAAGSSRFFIDESTGNVGIGTVEPKGFHVLLPEGSRGTRPGPGVTIAGGQSGNASIELRNAGTGTPYIDFAQDGATDDYDARIRLTAADSLAIEGANLGIGETSPKRKLHIGGGGQVSLAQANSVVTTSQAGIYWHSNNNYAIHRTPGPWTNPTFQQLRIDWDTGIVLAPGTGNNQGYEKSYVEITTGKGLRVSQGTVGIGVANPGAKLDVNGDIRTNVALISDNPYGAAYASFSHRNQGTAGHYALLQHSAGESFLNAPAGKNINFRINNATKMMVNANGSVSINALASLNVADSFYARIRCADFNIGHSSRKGGLGRA